MVFQEFSLVPTLTVAQNIFLGVEPLASGLIRDREAVARAREVFAQMEVDVDPTATVGRLGTAYWQLTEIAKALAQDARVLIMDEPTASLAKHEADNLFELVGRLKARGISIIYISHRMDEVFRIADRITILRDGRRLLTESLSRPHPGAGGRGHRRPGDGRRDGVPQARRPLRPRPRADARCSSSAASPPARGSRTSPSPSPPGRSSGSPG